MKYIIEYPSRLLWAIIVTFTFLIFAALAYLVEFIWKFKTPYCSGEIDLLHSDTWEYPVGVTIYDRDCEYRTVYKTPFHWAFKVRPYRKRVA